LQQYLFYKALDLPLAAVESLQGEGWGLVSGVPVHPLQGQVL